MSPPNPSGPAREDSVTSQNAPPDDPLRAEVDAVLDSWTDKHDRRLQDLRETLIRTWRDFPDHGQRPDAKIFFLEMMWPALRPGYERMEKEMEHFLKKELGSANPDIDIKKICTRVKQADSIAKSIDRRAKKTPSILDDPDNIIRAVHDLLGTKVIVNSRDNLIATNKTVWGSCAFQEVELPDKKANPNHFLYGREIKSKDRLPENDWFPENGAYQCTNYAVALPSRSSDHQGLSEYDGVVFELQVTTLSDYLFSILSHPLIYKKKESNLGYGQQLALDNLRGILKQLPIGLARLQLEFNTLEHTIVEGLITDIEGEVVNVEKKLRPGAASKGHTDFKMVLERLESTMSALARLYNNLAPPQGAEYDDEVQAREAACHINSRTELFDNIIAWVTDFSIDAKKIFWLHGKLGMGKSTISRSLPSRLKKHVADEVCIISFFFKSGEQDRSNASRFFTTLAFQLAREIPELRAPLVKVLDDVPDVKNKPLSVVFEKLVLYQLKRLKLERRLSIVVIVDALDECDNKDEHIHTVISSVSQLVDLSVHCRVFLTSRDEHPVRLALNTVLRSKPDSLEMIELNLDHVNSAPDILHYLTDNLEMIRRDHNDNCKYLGLDVIGKLPETWPKQHISTLVAMAGPLFIFAATVVRFVNGRGDPGQRLEEVLEWKMGDLHSKSDLATAYRHILDKATSEWERGYFQDKVGVMILLVEPLSLTSLAELLGIVERDPLITFADRLRSLRAVLDFESGCETAIRVFHKSFSDFLLGSDSPGLGTSENPFRINQRATHRAFALHCLRVTKKLKQDICNLGHPGTERTEIDADILDKAIPPDLRYACCHWAHHLNQARSDAGASHNAHKDDELDEKLKNFLKQHLLHWIEVMSLLGKVSDCVYMVVDIQRITTETEIATILHDAYRFLLYFRPILETAPLQVYASGLTFAPTASKLRELYAHDYPVWVRPGAHADHDWDQTLMTLDDSDNDPIRRLVSSPNGTMIASVHEKTVEVRDSITGKHLYVLPKAEHVVFSDDSSLIITFEKYWDHFRNVGQALIGKIWHSTSGKLVQELGDHEHDVDSDDSTIRPWIFAARAIRNFPSWMLWAISSDSCKIVVHNPSGTWVVDTATGEMITGLAEHGVEHANFSANSSLVAVIARPQSNEIPNKDRSFVQIWSFDKTSPGAIRITDPEVQNAHYVAFLPDGSEMAILPRVRSRPYITLWDTSNGKQIKKVQLLSSSETFVREVCFLDHSRAAIDVALKDFGGRNELRVVDVTKEPPGPGESHSGRISEVRPSPDYSKVVLKFTSWKFTAIAAWNMSGSMLSRPLKLSCPANKIDTITHLEWVDCHRIALYNVQYLLRREIRQVDSRRIWNVETGAITKLADLNHRVCGIFAFSPDGSQVLRWQEDAEKPDNHGGKTLHQLRVFDTETSRLRLSCTVTLPPGCSFHRLAHSNDTYRAALSPDGSMAAAALDFHIVFVALDGDNETPVTRALPLFWDHDEESKESKPALYRSLAFSRCSSRLVSLASFRTPFWITQQIHVFNPETGQMTQKIDIRQDCASYLIFDPTSSRVFTARGTYALNLAKSSLAPLKATPEIFYWNAMRQPLRKRIPSGATHEGYGLSEDRASVTKDSKMILWLPPDYRSPLNDDGSIEANSQVFGSSIVIGDRTGKAIILTFGQVWAVDASGRAVSVQNPTTLSRCFQIQGPTSDDFQETDGSPETDNFHASGGSNDCNDSHKPDSHDSDKSDDSDNSSDGGGVIIFTGRPRRKA